MTDTIQNTITALDEKAVDHFHAVATLTGLIQTAYGGELSPDEIKQLVAFVGRVVSDVECGCIDTFTGVASLDEARKLAEAGVPDFLTLIEIGAE